MTADITAPYIEILLLFENVSAMFKSCLGFLCVNIFDKLFINWVTNLLSY